MKTETKEKNIEHPLESVFGIEPGTTVVEYQEGVISEIIEMPDYDEKDNEIEYKLEEIYSMAIVQAQVLADSLETAQDQHVARIGEVTATMLSVALGSVREKRMMKEHKDKLSPRSRADTQITNNNLIVADRNEILKMLASKTP
jgi:hypothetical protein